MNTEPESAVSGIFTLLNAKQIRIINATHATFERGIELFAARADKEWSLTDCISFLVMEDERLTDALTGDRHFEQAGFKALLLG